MNVEEIRKKVRSLCEDAGLQFFFAVPNASEWAVTDCEHLRKIVSYHKELETLPLVTPTQNWIPVSERLPKPFTYVNATCRSLVDNREDWVVETIYLPIPKENNERGYSDWGNIPMLNLGKAEVIAWMERKIPEPYKESDEE